MSIKGFLTNNGVQKYDYNSLDNIPSNGGTLIVSVIYDDEGMRASHTPAEMFEAVQQGKTVMLNCGDGEDMNLVPLATVGSTYATFKHETDSPSIDMFDIAEDGVVDYYEIPLATADATPLIVNINNGHADASPSVIYETAQQGRPVWLDDGGNRYMLTHADESFASFYYLTDDGRECVYTVNEDRSCTNTEIEFIANDSFDGMVSNYLEEHQYVTQNDLIDYASSSSPLIVHLRDGEDTADQTPSAISEAAKMGRPVWLDTGSNDSTNIYTLTFATESIAYFVQFSEEGFAYVYTVNADGSCVHQEHNFTTNDYVVDYVDTRVNDEGYIDRLVDAVIAALPSAEGASF